MYAPLVRELASKLYLKLKSVRAVALLLDIGKSTVSKWKGQCFECKLRVPKVHSIGPYVKDIVKKNPLITLDELRCAIAKETHTLVSKELCRTVMKATGVTRKKVRFFGKASNAESKTYEFVKRRNELLRKHRMVFSVDETSFGRNMKSVYGYSMKGESISVRKKMPRVTTLSVLACAASSGTVQTSQRQGAYNTDAFLKDMQSFIIPENSIVLLDNVRFHHAKRFKELALLKKWHVVYTPPYSPWYNPVEGVFSIMKRSWYKHQDLNRALASEDAGQRPRLSGRKATMCMLAPCGRKTA